MLFVFKNCIFIANTTITEKKTPKYHLFYHTNTFFAIEKTSPKSVERLFLQQKEIW